MVSPAISNRSGVSGAASVADTLEKSVVDPGGPKKTTCAGFQTGSSRPEETRPSIAPVIHRPQPHEAEPVSVIMPRAASGSLWHLRPDRVDMPPRTPNLERVATQEPTGETQVKVGDGQR